MSNTSVNVAVIDYGMGNLHSVASALEKVGDGVKVMVTDCPSGIAATSNSMLASARVEASGLSWLISGQTTAAAPTAPTAPVAT